MASTRIILYKQKTLQNGQHPIMLQIIHNRKVKRINLGYSSKPDEWDFKISRPKRNHPNYKRLDNFLGKKEAEVKDQLLKLEDIDRINSIEDIVKFIKNENDSIYLLSYMKSIIKELKKAKKNGNASTYKNVRSVLNTYLNEKDVLLNRINYKWLKNFETYNLNKGNSVNAISVYMRTIRAVINRAIKENILRRDEYPFYQYKVKTKKTKKRAISKLEIDQIKSIELPENTNIWHAKNYFMFSFYTRGMNWSDMAKLKLSNINDGKIKYIRSKTDKEYSIKVNNQIQSILDYYIFGKSKDSFIFPIITRISDPELILKDIKNGLKTTNKHLKRIAKLCNIETNLTTYVARHTWATIAKKMNYSVEIIAEGLGNEDIKTTQIYLDDFDDNVLDDANDLITS